MILVGGSTRIPAVQNLARETDPGRCFGPKTSVKYVDQEFGVVKNHSVMGYYMIHIYDHLMGHIYIYIYMMYIYISVWHIFYTVTNLI